MPDQYKGQVVRTSVVPLGKTNRCPHIVHDRGDASLGVLDTAGRVIHRQNTPTADQKDLAKQGLLQHEPNHWMQHRAGGTDLASFAIPATTGHVQQDTAHRDVGRWFVYIEHALVRRRTLPARLPVALGSDGVAYRGAKCLVGRLGRHRVIHGTG